MLNEKQNHLKKLQNIFGKANVFFEPIDCFGYSYDSAPQNLNINDTPDFVCKAHSSQEISDLLKYANVYKIPVTVRGTGSGRSGGAIPIKKGIVLVLDEMNNILELDEMSMTITVEAGVRTKDIHDYCADFGLYYPPEPSSYAYSTIGGNLAENAGGIRAVKYGVTSNYVMALEVVLANGDIINTGGKLIKNVTGYNLTQLLVGSEGTLGIITKATLRLISLPKNVKSAIATFPTVEDACIAVGHCLRSGVVPTAAELMDKLSCEATAKFNAFPIDTNVGAMLVFDIDGNTEEICASDMSVLERICKEHHCISFTLSKDEEDRERLWSLRRKLGTAIKSMAPDRIGEDISVPRSELPHISNEIMNIADKYGFLVSIYGHAGDGNLHPSFLADLSESDAQKRMNMCIEETFKKAVEYGGVLSGEHGIGTSKQKYIGISLSNEVINTSLLIKKALDPNNILNPGKIFNR